MTIHEWEIASEHTGPTRSGAVVHLTRTRSLRDSVCDGFDWLTEHERMRQGAESLVKTPDDAVKRRVVRRFKRIRRCAQNEASAESEHALRKLLAPNPEVLSAILDLSLKPLGGYAHTWSPWSSHVQSVLRSLGSEPLSPLHFHTVGDFGVDYTGSVHRHRSSETAKKNTPVLAKAELVGLSGHHYTSHLAPGFFTDIHTGRGFDVRYHTEENPDGFENVRLILASGCSLLCSGAFEVLRTAFPQAVLLGAQKTMRIESPKGYEVRHHTGRLLSAGEVLWKRFREGVLASATPLLLDNKQDFKMIAFQWESAMLQAVGPDILSTVPGWILGNTAHLMKTPAVGATTLVDASSLTENPCERKADDRSVLPGPR